MNTLKIFEYRYIAHFENHLRYQHFQNYSNTIALHILNILDNVKIKLKYTYLFLKNEC